MSGRSNRGPAASTWTGPNVPRPRPRTPRLVLDGNVGLGALLVADHPVEHGWNGWGWGGDGGWFASHSHPVALGTNEACFPSAGASRLMRPPNVTVLLTGIAVLALGVLLVLDADGTIDLRFAYMAPVLVGALGAILLASGLAGRRRGRG